MGHLSADQLIDLVEGTRPESSLPHLQACDGCRRQLANLRATMSMVDRARPQEPSPLVWESVAPRVHEAISAERTRSTSIVGRLASAAVAAFSWSSWRAVQVAAVAVLVIAAGLLVQRQRPSLPASVPSLLDAADATDLGAVSDDASLSLVADLAAELDWESAAEAGLTTHVGVDDDLVNQLTDAERRELRHLLQGELAPPRRGA